MVSLHTTIALKSYNHAVFLGVLVVLCLGYGVSGCNGGKSR